MVHRCPKPSLWSGCMGARTVCAKPDGNRVRRYPRRDTRFCLLWYNLASARAYSASKSSCGSSRAPATDAVTLSPFKIEDAFASTSRFKRCVSTSRCACLKEPQTSTANSSPPKRTPRSCGRVALVMACAAATRHASPAGCPKRSFRSCILSMSIRTKAAGRSVARVSCIALRFARPVRPSRHAIRSRCLF